MAENKSWNKIENIKKTSKEKVLKKVEKKMNKIDKKLKTSWNIARGTTDPGHWVYNLNPVYD